MTTLTVEQLEQRLTPAAAPEIYPWAGNLYIDGTEARDVIVVAQVVNTVAVWINGDKLREFAAPPGVVVVSGMGGNDLLIAVGDARIELYGDGGRDVLVGGSGADMLFGGAGNDVIFGGAGDDVLFGEAGRDRLFGGAGDDMLLGNHGRDRLWGEGGADRLADSPDDVLIDFESGVDRRLSREHSLASFAG